MQPLPQITNAKLHLSETVYPREFLDQQILPVAQRRASGPAA